MGNAMHFLENPLHIRGEVERFREDDDIEFAIQFQLLARHDMKFSFGDQSASGSNLFLSNIDAGNIAIWK